MDLRNLSFQYERYHRIRSNALGSHLLLDNDKVYELAKQGYDVVQISAALGSDINLMLIKLQEMNKLGYDFNIPFTP